MRRIVIENSIMRRMKGRTGLDEIEMEKEWWEKEEEVNDLEEEEEEDAK